MQSFEQTNPTGIWSLKKLVYFFSRTSVLGEVTSNSLTKLL